MRKSSQKSQPPGLPFITSASSFCRLIMFEYPHLGICSLLFMLNALCHFCIVYCLTSSTRHSPAWSSWVLYSAPVPNYIWNFWKGNDVTFNAPGFEFNCIHSKIQSLKREWEFHMTTSFICISSLIFFKERQHSIWFRFEKGSPRCSKSFHFSLREWALTQWQELPIYLFMLS